jgi:hypothetical protein
MYVTKKNVMKNLQTTKEEWSREQKYEKCGWYLLSHTKLAPTG